MFMVRLGGASSVMRAVPVAAGYSMKEGSSISVSFWLRVLWHGGAGFRSRNGLFCVPCARCTRAVAPSLLCEELAVILVDGDGSGARAHPCEALAWGLLSLSSSHPSTGSVWWWSGTWVDPVLLSWTYHCFRLGDWSLGRPASSVACRPSPSHGLARLGVHVCLHTFEMLSVLFPGNIGLHFLGISRSFFGNVCFLLFLELLASSCPGSYGRVGGSAGLCLHPPASVGS